MPKYPGRIISATPPSVSTSGASGVWTTEEVAQYEQAGTWPVAVLPPGDPNFNQTVLLLHGDGTNGAQNNTFLDSSTNNFTITRNGNTTQGTFSPFSVGAGQWSNYFDGNDHLSLGTQVIPSSGDFTVEGWFNVDSYSARREIVFQCDATSAVDGRFFTYVNTSGKFACFIGGANRPGEMLTTTTVQVGTWYHFAVVRSGNDYTVYINGVSEATGSGTGTIAANNTLIARNSVTGVNTYWLGYLSNIRITTSAVYSTNFTPSASPLTDITNTVLLTCQSNRFIDANTQVAAKTVTVSGNPRVTPFSPFAPTAAYDPAVNGGSGYFDGNDYLNLGGQSEFAFGTDDFTVQFWYYSQTAGTTQLLYDSRPPSTQGNYLNIQRSSGNVILVSLGGSGVITGTQTIQTNAWTHIAVSRMGTDSKLFINGVQDGSTVTDTTTYLNSSARPRIFASGFILGSYGVGYLSGLRVQKGTGYSSIALPTTPPTDETNTVLLCNFTNAGIFDNTGKNNLETVGNAQIDTTTKKYGTGSLEFDGTGDWLLMPNTPDQQLGTGNFTIEFWVYLATGDIGSARGLVAKGTSTTGFLVSLDSSQKVVFTFTTSTITSSGAITLDAWNHIAVVREGTGSNQTKIYINGTNDGTGTVSTDFNQTSVMYVGANRTGGDAMKGFIDDLRITKGVARYTANFTPPTGPFEDQ